MLLTIDRKEAERIFKEAGIIPDGYFIAQITRGTGGQPNLKLYLEKKPIKKSDDS